MCASAPPDWLADSHGVPQLSEPRNILDLLNYQLYMIESASSMNVTRLCEGDFGITRREWRFLAILAASGPLSPSELAVRAGLDRSRTSKGVMGLLSKRLLSREALPGDRRRARVALTSDGEALYARAFPRVRALNLALLDALAPAEAAVLAQLLNRLRRQAATVSRAGLVSASADRRRGGSRRVAPRSP